jgi:hypothetical protein
MRPTRTLLLALPLLLIFVGSALAAPDVPTPDADAAEWLKALYSAATAGEWKILAGLALVGVVWLLRSWGVKALPWFGTKTGGLALAFLVSIGGTFGLALAAGAKLSLASAASALGTAAAAAGVWEWLKAHMPGVQKANDATKAKADG